MMQQQLPQNQPPAIWSPVRRACIGLRSACTKHHLASLYAEHVTKPSVRFRVEKTSWQAPSVVLTDRPCLLLREQFDITRYPADDQGRGGGWVHLSQAGAVSVLLASDCEARFD
jgi:hypothetical protein